MYPGEGDSHLSVPVYWVSPRRAETAFSGTPPYKIVIKKTETP
jgi:hypothetical protein